MHQHVFSDSIHAIWYCIFLLKFYFVSDLLQMWSWDWDVEDIHVSVCVWFFTGCWLSRFFLSWSTVLISCHSVLISLGARSNQTPGNSSGGCISTPCWRHMKRLGLKNCHLWLDRCHNVCKYTEAIRFKVPALHHNGRVNFFKFSLVSNLPFSSFDVSWMMRWK